MPSLNQIRNLGSLQKSYRYKVLFAKLPAVVTGIDVNALNLLAETSELPRSTHEKITISLHGMQFHETGRSIAAGTITMTFRETESPLVRDLVAQWEKGIFDLQSGVASDKSGSEAIIVIQQLDSNDNPTMTYRLEGCFLEEADLGSLEGGSSETQVITLSISYDNYTATVGG